MASLAEMLEWKYGLVANTKQGDPNDTSPNPEMVISAWKHPTIPQPSKTQLKKDLAEYKIYQDAKEQRSEDRKSAKQVLKDKHKDKKASELTADDVTEWSNLKMAEELDLEIN